MNENVCVWVRLDREIINSFGNKSINFPIQNAAFLMIARYCFHRFNQTNTQSGKDDECNNYLVEFIVVGFVGR